MKYLSKPVAGLFLLFTFVTSSLFAQFNLSQPIPIDPAVKVGKLPNGLTYYIQKNAKPEKKVELRLVVNAGSILEDPDQLGLAHFMEHMNFNGSKNFPKNELVDYLQKVGVKFGADLNAYTSFDETVYMLPLSTEDPEVLNKGFLVLEDWAFNNLLDKNEIEKERGVVLEESRLSKGADERMSRQYFPKLFNGSKYANRLPIGKDSILRKFTPAALERFYKQWYRPNLMAVVVVGDINIAEMEAKIKKHFGSYKNPATIKPRPAIIPIPARVKPDAMVLTDDEATNTMLQMYNFVTPAKKVVTWADYRDQVKRQVINALINARLEELTQKENPPFTFAYTGRENFIRGYEAFISFAMLGDNKSDEAINALMMETERARKFGFLEAELSRAKASMLNDAERAAKEKDKTQSASLVYKYVNHFLEKTPSPGPEDRLKFFKQVLPTITLAEINKEVALMPAATNAFALITAPSAEKEKLPNSAQLQKQVLAASKLPVTKYEEKAIAASLLEGAPEAGKVVEERSNASLKTTTYTLSNGVTITIKPTAFKNDQIVMDAWRWGGWQRFPLEVKDNAKYAAQVVSTMGVKDMNPTDLQKFLAGKTVQVTPYLNDHEEGIEGSSSVKDFETFLQLVNLYFTNPRQDESLFKSFISKNKSMLGFMKANPAIFYTDTMVKIAYNNSPWVTAVPSVEEFNNLDLGRIMEIYKNVYGNAHGMHFTFVGNIEPEKAKPLLEQYLGSLPGEKTERMYRDNGVRIAKGRVEADIKKGKEQQSMITVIWEGPADYVPEEMMALSALTEALNIKITEKLREEIAGMYSGGMGGNIQKRPYTHYSIQATIPCGPENVQKLTTALFDLIKSAREKGIDQKDLDKVKESWKKKYKERLESNDAWLSHLSNSFINQTDPELILSYEKRVNDLTTEDVRKVAEKYLSLDNYVKVVLYPEVIEKK